MFTGFTTVVTALTWVYLWIDKPVGAQGVATTVRGLQPKEDEGQVSIVGGRQTMHALVDPPCALVGNMTAKINDQIRG